MQNNFTKQAWVAFKIWVLAVLFNTLSGMGVLTNYFSDMTIARELLLYGLMFGAIYSFPVFLVLLLIINRCAAKKVNGLLLFSLVFFSGIVLTVAVFLFFTGGLRFFDEEDMSLLIAAVLSGITAITLQYRSLFRLGSGLTTQTGHKA